MTSEQQDNMRYGCFDPDDNVYICIDKATGKEIEIVKWGSMGCYDRDMKYVDFYSIEIKGLK